MSGLDIKIPYTGDPDSTLPYAGDYDKLETVGSLALLELAHSSNPFSGVPQAGDIIPNILWNQLSAARVAGGLAASTATSSAFKRTTGNASTASGNDVSNKTKSERTPKGGLHGIISQTACTNSSDQVVVISGGADLASYITAFPSHKYYVSIWDRLTRAALSSEPAESQIPLSPSSTASYLYAIRSATILGGGEGTSQVPAAPATLGNRFRAAGITAATGTGTAVVYPFAVGPTGPYYSTGTNSYTNKAASRVLYRWYLEDLTVSGRTYAEVLAADYALYQQAFGVGGRYYGDTLPTDPSTIP